MMNTSPNKPNDQLTESVTREEFERLTEELQEIAAQTAPRWMKYLTFILESALLVILALIAKNVFL